VELHLHSSHKSSSRDALLIKRKEIFSCIVIFRRKAIIFCAKNGHYSFRKKFELKTQPYPLQMTFHFLEYNSAPDKVPGCRNISTDPSCFTVCLSKGKLKRRGFSVEYRCLRFSLFPPPLLIYLGLTFCLDILLGATLPDFQHSPTTG
jgi:hypothetical protein